MSLAIDVDKVTRVLLADGWHDIAEGAFTLDAYEYVYDTHSDYGTELVHGGGHSGICSTGFSFRITGRVTASGRKITPRYIAGPLSAILAVEYRGES